MPLLGTAKFTWTDPDTGAQEHALNVPLQRVRPAASWTAFRAQSLDRSVTEVIDVGGVYEVVAEIRYDDAPQSLIDLLIAGVRGLTITYDDGNGNTFPCILISPAGPDLDAGFDRDQRAFDEHTVTVRLRKADGTAFDSAIF